MIDWLEFKKDHYDAIIKIDSRFLKQIRSLIMISIFLIIFVISEISWSSLNKWSYISLGLNIGNLIWFLPNYMETRSALRHSKRMQRFYERKHDEELQKISASFRENKQPESASPVAEKL